MAARIRVSLHGAAHRSRDHPGRLQRAGRLPCLKQLQLVATRAATLPPDSFGPPAGTPVIVTMATASVRPRTPVYRERTLPPSWAEAPARQTTGIQCVVLLARDLLASRRRSRLRAIGASEHASGEGPCEA